MLPEYRLTKSEKRSSFLILGGLILALVIWLQFSGGVKPKYPLSPDRVTIPGTRLSLRLIENYAAHGCCSTEHSFFIIGWEYSSSYLPHYFVWPHEPPRYPTYPEINDRRDESAPPGFELLEEQTVREIEIAVYQRTEEPSRLDVIIFAEVEYENEGATIHGWGYFAELEIMLAQLETMLYSLEVE